MKWSEFEDYVKSLAITKDRFEKDWDEALKHDAVWNLVTEFLSKKTESAEEERALVKEYVDKTIEIMKPK